MTSNQRKKLTKANLEVELKIAGVQEASDGRPLGGLLKQELLNILEELIRH